MKRKGDLDLLRQEYPGQVRVDRDSFRGTTLLARLFEHVTSSTSPGTHILVLEHADVNPQVLVNFAEMIEWLQQQTTPDDGFLQGVQVRAETENNLPHVVLTRKESFVMLSSADSSEPLPEEVVTRRTQSWVRRILVELGICPFTKSVRKSGQGLRDLGVPVAAIAYHYSSASLICPLMADAWRAIDAMAEDSPLRTSSILLVAPGFDDSFDVWSGPIFCLLEAGVVAAEAAGDLGVVCFHPRYATPDGSTWPGFGHMHSVPRLKQWVLEHDPKSTLTEEDVAAGGAWQRRTPHSTINVLWAQQLAAAENRRSSGSLYNENIQKLVGSEGIGSKKLEQDLERERNLQ